MIIIRSFSSLVVGVLYLRIAVIFFLGKIGASRIGNYNLLTSDSIFCFNQNLDMFDHWIFITNTILKESDPIDKISQ